MQAVSDLAKLRDSVISRCRLFQTLAAGIRNPISARDRRDLSFLVIEIDNLVVVGLRQFTKSSLLRCRTASGQRVQSTSTAQSPQEAAAHILKVLQPQKFLNQKSPVIIHEKDEESVRDPKKVAKALHAYSASNLPNLNLALSLNAQVFGEAKVFRHYLAHRAQNTYDSVCQFAANEGFAKPRIPEELLVRGRPSTGVSLVDGWTGDLINFFDYAC